jgi:WD40 repeat protein/tRNA A-37 threonylcarbamoyl transferase component Bud32
VPPDDACGPDDPATRNPSGASGAENAPTFPAEAESLLRHLQLGAVRWNPHAPPPGSFPSVPNYEIECEIGHGGMGVVYRARHRTLHHTVAIKMILASAHAAPAEVARFLAEAEAIAAVKHPNVVQVYDLDCSGPLPYFVMEYVEGGNLARRLGAERLAPRTAAALLEAVTRGVQAAHDAGIVHRDLKPANILLHVERRTAEGDTPGGPVRLEDATPKVSDFGLAKRLSSDLTRSQAVMGTPQYMAPEQAGKAKFVGPGADVYALGVILYECLTGSVPFRSDDAWSLIRQVLEDRPEAPGARVPGVPRDLELICLKCLEKEPHHRYPSAAALGDDLRRFLNREPVSVRPVGPVSRAFRWTRRRPAAAGLGALAALLVLVLPPLLVGVRARLDQAREREQAARVIADTAEGARVAAERLAEARKLFAVRGTLRARATARPLGWTAATRAELPEAVALAADDPTALVDLRSTAAGAALAADLFPVEPVAERLSGSVLATDPRTGRVAVGEFKARGSCRVLLIDPTAPGEPARQLSFPVDFFATAQDGTRSLAFSPDGAHLFVGTRRSRVFGFDLTEPANSPARSWPAPPGTVEQLAVSADGKTVYGLSPPGASVLSWSAETGAPGEPFVSNDGAAIESFAVLPSGELLACNGRALFRWTAARQLVETVPNRPWFRLAPAGGPMLLFADGPTLAVAHRDAGEPTDRFPDPTLRRTSHEEVIRTIAVHPSGAFAATASGDTDRTVKVWELASGRLVGTVLVTGTERIAVAWSGDGKYLLATAADRVERWALVPSAVQRFACASGCPLSAAALGRADRVAAVGAHADGTHDVFLGAPGRAAEVARVPGGCGNGRAGVAIAPDGTLAVTLPQPGVFAWKPGAALPAPALTKQSGWCPRFGPTGDLWAVADSCEVQRFDPATGGRAGRWRNDLGRVMHGLSSVDALAVGRTVAVAGGREGAAFVLHPMTCQPTATFRLTGDPVLAMALSPDEAVAVAGTQTGKLCAVRTADGSQLSAVPAHPKGVTAVSFSRDGTLLATGGRDCTVRFWKRAGDGFELLFEVDQLPGQVRDLQFGASDDRLMVLLDHEHAVRVWDTDRLRAHLTDLKLGW